MKTSRSEIRTAYLEHPAMQGHDTGPEHPEITRRLSVLEEKFFGKRRYAHLEALVSRLMRVTASRHDDLYDIISQIHTLPYIESLKAALPTIDRIYLDPDTALSPGSLLAAELAVSSGLQAVDLVMEGRVKNAFCAVRPPGHHAEAGRAMGFCLFNNIAIASKYIQTLYHLERVMIIDWDVHHGNGTQNSFYEDSSVFYFSTHQSPCYPGTGAENERGKGLGAGFTENHPLPAGSGDAELLSIFEHDLPRAVSNFSPDFILISAGFDAHVHDPLASLEVTDEGFGAMTKVLASLADEHCNGRIVSFLEGGYNLNALASSVEQHLGVLSDFY